MQATLSRTRYIKKQFREGKCQKQKAFIRKWRIAVAPWTQHKSSKHPNWGREASASHVQSKQLSSVSQFSRPWGHWWVKQTRLCAAMTEHKQKAVWVAQLVIVLEKIHFIFHLFLNRMTSILEHSGWKPFWYLFLFWRQIVLMYSPLFYISLCVNFCVHTASTQILEQFAHKLCSSFDNLVLCTYNKNVVGRFYPKLSYCKPYIILFLIKGYWKQISRIINSALPFKFCINILKAQLRFAKGKCLLDFLGLVFMSAVHIQGRTFCKIVVNSPLNCWQC